VAPGGRAYHVINRGNRRMRIFFGEGHYRAFMRAMADALDQVPMRILGWRLMSTIQEDCHLLCVLRHVEVNALRSAADWPWGSLAAYTGMGAGAMEARRWRKLLAEWPVDRPANWSELVDDPLEQTALFGVRTSVDRGRPYGEANWVQRAVAMLGLAHTVRRPGRPRKHVAQVQVAK